MRKTQQKRGNDDDDRETSLPLLRKKEDSYRRQILNMLSITFLLLQQPASAFTPGGSIPRTSAIDLTTKEESNTGDGVVNPYVAYKPLSFSMDSFVGTTIPVACWFPVDQRQAYLTNPKASYYHCISVRRIGELLPKWDFIPSFVKKDFAIPPSAPNVVDGSALSLPFNKPVILLAHGFLGSRFDLSHLAETLASEGFLCLAAEYPESLAASYERREGLSRRAINDELLSKAMTDWKLRASSYGVVGHSLGCGTVLEVGDESWARVSIAGYPKRQDGTPILGNGLQVASLNDGLVMMRNGKVDDFVQSEFQVLQEATPYKVLPKRSALVFDRPDAPNHISFLSEGVNEAMIEFLSPLLPIAKALDIPVLDFDRYQDSRDSKATADVVHPIILQYLKQEMALSTVSDG